MRWIYYSYLSQKLKTQKSRIKYRFIWINIRTLRKTLKKDIIIINYIQRVISYIKQIVDCW